MGPDVDKIFHPIEDLDHSVMFNQKKKRNGISSEQAVHAGTCTNNNSSFIFS